MKKIMTLITSLGLLASVNAAEFKPGDYKELQSSIIKTMPQDYSNKKIKATLTFIRIQASPTPDYLEKQFDERKYAILWTSPNEGALPIVVKKSSDLGEQVLALKSGSSLIVYGRVKKVKSKPKGPKGHKVREFSRAAEFYIELAHMEVSESTDRGRGTKTKRKGRKF